MAKIIKAPNAYEWQRPSVFLAGSIDLGKAEDWQARVTQELLDFDIDILNPRRDNWDWSTEQSINNKTFNEQVTWEQDALLSADLIVVYFAAGSQSPITLMEFGQFVEMGDMIVYCPEGFWRKGNVGIVAYRNSVPVYDDYENFIEAVKKACERLAKIN